MDLSSADMQRYLSLLVRYGRLLILEMAGGGCERPYCAVGIASWPSESPECTTLFALQYAEILRSICPSLPCSF